MMVEVKKADLGLLLPQRHEDGVEHVGEAGHPGPPAEPQFAHRSRPNVGPVRVVEVEKSAAVVDADDQLVEEVGVDEDHGDVVGQHRLPEFKWLPVGHEGGEEPADEGQVSADDRQNLPDAAVHQRHRARSRVLHVDPVLVRVVKSRLR